MKKEMTKIASALIPMPNLIVSCCDKEGRNNALAVGSAAMISGSPCMLMIGIMPEKFSYPIIKETKEFVINVPTEEMRKQYFYLGTKSGRDEDKFEALNLVWEKGKKVNAPILMGCPVNLECKVVASMTPGDSDHELFFATLETAHCDEEYLTKSGNIDWKKINTI